MNTKTSTFVGIVGLFIGLLSPTAGKAGAVAPVRMGCGIITFDTVPGWGLDADGNTAPSGENTTTPLLALT